MNLHIKEAISVGMDIEYASLGIHQIPDIQDKYHIAYIDNGLNVKSYFWLESI